MSYFGGLCRTIGTIIGRTRKDGSKAFTAQIVIKKGGAIVHREAETFDRKQAANAWIVRHEAELKRPGGLERKEDPTLASVIDRYIAESKNAVLGTKAQVLKTIKNGELGETAHAKDCGFRALLNAKTRRDHVLRWEDLNGDRILVRDMKHPGERRETTCGASWRPRHLRSYNRCLALHRRYSPTLPMRSAPLLPAPADF